MGAAEVGIGHLQGHRELVIAQRLGESQRPAGEPAIEQAHGEVDIRLFFNH